MRGDWIDDATYELAARFREECLLKDGTLLSDGVAVHSAENLDALLGAIEPPDHSQGTFTGKLIAQTAGQPDVVIRLAAELVAVQLLGEEDVGGAVKTEHVEALLGAMRTPVALDDRLRSALRGGGVANYGANKNRRDVLLRFLVRATRTVKMLDEEERQRALSDPFRFRDLIATERSSANGMTFYALLHLLFPETFSTAVAAGNRNALLGKFAPVLTAESDEDRRLLHLQELVNEQAGHEINFYDSVLRDVWEAEPDERWSELVEWAARLYAHPRFAEEEHDYKRRVADQLEPLPAAVGQDGWVDALRRVIRHREQNLLDWRQADRFLNWCEQEPATAVRALACLGWSASGEDAELPDDASKLIGRFVASVPTGILGGIGGQLAMASFLRLAIDPEYTPPFRWTPYTRLNAILQLEVPPATDPDDGRPQVERVWNDWVLTIEELRLRMLTRGVILKDDLDAQGLAYWIASYDPPADWDEASRNAFLRFQAGPDGALPDDSVPSGPQEPVVDGELVLPEVTPVLARELNLPFTWLRDTQALLAEKRQLIFYGPPGTGKTWIARRLGRHIAGDTDALRLVQFHPSYTYEDFFEGYRPHTDEDGQLTYRLTHGPLRLLAQRAREQPHQPHVLIIDEINRGNVAKVFGELYFLLEYRDEEITLQYSPEHPFALPDNLFVIGTMNTADRSIALVDTALRRRFHFQALMPTRDPVSLVLQTWLSRHGFDLEPDELLKELNDRIDDEDFSIGPSYFISEPPRPPDLEHVWNHQLLPLLEEHFFERRREIPDQFGLKALRAAIATKATGADAPPTENPASNGVPADDLSVG